MGADVELASLREGRKVRGVMKTLSKKKSGYNFEKTVYNYIKLTLKNSNFQKRNVEMTYS